MNDMDLLRSFQADLEPADSRPPAAIRRRLVEEAGRTTSRRTSVTSARPVKWMVPAGASVAAAALLFAVATNGPSGDSGPTIATGPVTAQNSRATGEVNLELNAGTILLAAATSARAESEKTPDGSAFIYNLAKETHVVHPAGGGARVRSGERESWFSVDGTRVGALTSFDDDRGTNDLILHQSNCKRVGSADCNQIEGYLRHAPTTRDAMLRYLKAGPSQSSAAVMFNAQQLLSEKLAPAPVRAAVFEAVATLPDVTVVTGATNALGQSGTSVSVVDQEENCRSEMIFDEGHQFIGTRDVSLTAEPGIPAGTLVSSSARITQAVVPTLGLRPDGTTRKVPPHSIWNRVWQHFS